MVVGLAMALLQLGIALPQGMLFGIGYGTGVRIGYEQVYPLLFPAGQRHTATETAKVIGDVNKIYNAIGGKEASQMGIAVGLANAGPILKNPDFLALEESESKSYIRTQLKLAESKAADRSRYGLSIPQDTSSNTNTNYGPSLSDYEQDPPPGELFNYNDYRESIKGLTKEEYTSLLSLPNNLTTAQKGIIAQLKASAPYSKKTTIVAEPFYQGKTAIYISFHKKYLEHIATVLRKKQLYQNELKRGNSAAAQSLKNQHNGAVADYYRHLTRHRSSSDYPTKLFANQKYTSRSDGIKSIV